MQIDPVEEWQRLTAEYREKYDGELLDLARDFADLTETAQLALRQEMRSRGLGDPAAPKATPPSSARPAPAIARVEPESGSEHPAIAVGILGRMPQLVPDAPEGADDGDAHDFTWKTLLCDCDTNEEAQELSRALRQAGLDAWIQQPVEFGRQYARVLVAADQLDQARVIAAQTNPQQVVEDEKDKAPEFVEPKCPKCGSDDVVLEGVDPENTWRCEQCDAQWTENLPGIEGASPKG